MKTSNHEIEDKIVNDSKENELMHELFEDQLKDILWAERELTQFMPELVESVTSVELKKTLNDHIKQTNQQVSRLEKVFDIMGIPAEAEKCEAMEGLIKEARKIIDKSGKSIITDAFIIGAVQKVEHYETASYGTLKSLATIIGEYEVSTLLGQTLREEKEADEKLTDVAENIVNIEASRKAGELEEEEDEDYEGLEEAEEEEVEMEEDETDDTAAGSKTRSRSQR